MKVEFNNVTVFYKENNLVALKNISFQIEDGEMIAIIGKSGAGKTSIFNAILNLAEIDKEGQILIDNKDWKTYSKKQKKAIFKKVGFLSQLSSLLPEETVYDSILRNYSKYKNKIFDFFRIVTKKQRLEIFSVLDKLGIFDKAFDKTTNLSGGQKQRVEIAKLLLKKVSLILADEPTTSLDQKTAFSVLDLLDKLNKEYKISFLVNMHDLSLVKKYFKKAICLKNGELISICETKNIDKDLIQKLYN